MATYLKVSNAKPKKKKKKKRSLKDLQPKKKGDVGVTVSNEKGGEYFRAKPVGDSPRTGKRFKVKLPKKKVVKKKKKRKAKGKATPAFLSVFSKLDKAMGK